MFIIIGIWVLILFKTPRPATRCHAWNARVPALSRQSTARVIVFCPACNRNVTVVASACLSGSPAVPAAGPAGVGRFRNTVVERRPSNHAVGAAISSQGYPAARPQSCSRASRCPFPPSAGGAGGAAFRREGRSAAVPLSSARSASAVAGTRAKSADFKLRSMCRFL